MVDAALDSFDYLILDTPPVSAFVDAAVLSTVADGTLLVVGQNFVRRDELASSHAQLEKAGANLIGAVMNLCKSEKSEYYTEYYSTVADGTLLVVGQNVVRRDELASSHAQLEKAGANLIGAVTNLCKSEKSEYYTEYYSRGGDDSNAPAAPVNAPTSQAVSKPSSPRPVARKASRAAGASRQ